MSKNWFKQLENIQPGDEIVISPPSYSSALLIKAVVEKVSKTQLIVGKESYMKNTGVRVGDATSNRPKSIAYHHLIGGDRRDLLTWNDADISNEKIELNNHKSDQTHKL
jgi:hypothetical protein